MTSPGPIAATTTWQTVMDAAGHRCQCENSACGSMHRDSDGRCDAHNWPGPPNTRFLVAPADPSTPAVEAAALPAADLMAWCEDCYRSAVRKGLKARKAAAAAAAAAPEPDSLF